VEAVIFVDYPVLTFDCEPIATDYILSLCTELVAMCEFYFNF
jgi:hypothetical protein